MKPVQVLQKQERTWDDFVGRLSDGSDHVRVTKREWEVQVLDRNGEQRALLFDHDPTAQEIYDRLPLPVSLVPTQKADLENYMIEAYENWQRWSVTAAAAPAKGITPASPLGQAIAAREASAWSDYRTLLDQWRVAP